MNLSVQLTTAGNDVGPFNIYYDVASAGNLLASNISRAQLLSGYVLQNVPNTAQNILLVDQGLCGGTTTLDINNVVTDGLTIWYEPGDLCSYPGSGSIIYNLMNVSGATGSIKNAPTYVSSEEGYLDLNGSTQYIESSPFTYDNKAFTWNLVLRINSIGNFENDRIIGSGDASVNFQMISRNKANHINAVEYYPPFFTTLVNNDGLNGFMITGSKYMLTFVSTTASVSMYVNGQFYASSSTAFSSNTLTKNILIGSSGIDGYSDADIFQVLLYSSSLTPSQISENFNVLNTRFSISGAAAPGPSPTPSITPTVSPSTVAGNIVTSGLILHLDANNAASYPGSGNSWYNLSRNSTASLQNSPTYNSSQRGKLVFNGTNQYATISPLQQYLPTGSSARTIAGLMQIGSVAPQWQWLLSYGSAAGEGGSYRNAFYIGANYDKLNAGSWDYTTGLNAPSAWTSSLWAYMAVTYNENTIALYKNGVLVATGSTNGLLETTNAEILIGKQIFYNEYYTGSISAINVYNRVLSQSEINQNWTYYSSSINFGAAPSPSVTPSIGATPSVTPSPSLNSTGSSNQITITEDMIFNMNGETSKNLIRLFDNDLNSKIDSDGNWSAHQYNPFYSFIVLSGSYNNLKIDYFDFSGPENLYLRVYDKNKTLLGSHTIDGSLWNHWRTVPGLSGYTNVRFLEIYAPTYPETAASIMEMKIYGDKVSDEPSVYPTKSYATPTDHGKYAHGVNTLDYLINRNDIGGSTIINKIFGGVRVYYEGTRFDHYPETYFTSLSSSTIPIHLGRFGESEGKDHITYWFSRSLSLDMKFQFAKTGGSIKNLSQAEASQNYTFLGNANDYKYIDPTADPEISSSWIGAAELFHNIVAIWGSNPSANLSPTKIYSGSTTLGRNLVEIFETGNEEDRHWVSTYYHTPEAWYLAHKMKYNRAKQADFTAKIYAPATPGYKLEYWKAVYFHHYWMSGSNAPFPADGFNMNLYINNGFIDSQQTGTDAISPEEADIHGKLMAQRELFAKIFPGKPLIWSEYGYATDVDSPYNVPTIGSKPVRHTQADWTLRLKAIAQATKFVEKMHYYAFFEDGTGPFNSMSVTKDIYTVSGSYLYSEVYPVGYALANEKFIENNYKFYSDIVTHGSASGYWVTKKDHVSDSNKKLYKVWRGTRNGSENYNLVIDAGTTISSATLYTTDYLDYLPFSASLTPSGTTVTLPTASEAMSWIEVNLSGAPASPSVTPSITPSKTVGVSNSPTPTPSITPSITPTQAGTGSIVTSGMVLHLDAANASSYPGSGTTWTNLTGQSFSATLQGNPTFDTDAGGAINFDGSGDYATISNTQFTTIPTGSVDRTIGAYVKYNNSGGDFKWIFTYGSSTTNENGCILGSVYGNAFGGILGQGASIAGVYSTTEFVYVTLVLSGSTAYMYKNGVFQGSNQIFGTINTTNDQILIGTQLNPYGTEYWVGKIRAIHMYNRALSASEILQNYNYLANGPAPSPSVSPSPNATPSVTPTITVSPSKTPTISITPSISPSAGALSAATFTARTGLSISPTTTGFYEYLPRGYNSPINSGTNYPLLIAYHGMGELGQNNLPLLLNVDVSRRLNNSIADNSQFPEPYNVSGSNYPMVVLTPQYWWNWADNNTQYTNAMIDYAIANYRIDTSRIYLSGLSLGGELVIKYLGAAEANSDRIAATILAAPSTAPIAGYSTNIATSGVPIWFMHSDDDPTVGIQWTTDAWFSEINAISPGLAKRTRLTGYGHNVWDRMYTPTYNIYSEGENMNLSATPWNFYQWLLSKTNVR